MRKVLVALVAIVSLSLVGGLVAAPKFSNSGRHASAANGIDIVSLTQRPRDLPEQSFPAH